MQYKLTYRGDEGYLQSSSGATGGDLIVNGDESVYLIRGRDTRLVFKRGRCVESSVFVTLI